MLMDSNSIMKVPESFLLAASPSSTTTTASYLDLMRRDNEDNIIIDLGLSLGTSLQPVQAYHHPSSQHFGNQSEYGELITSWTHQHHNQQDQNYPNKYMKSSSSKVYKTMMIEKQEDHNEDSEGVESKKRWAYVKVNMEGVVIGRKVCIFEHANYGSLAFQLEEMFGRHCISGLRLFNNESEFSLFYKDSNEHWRVVGDVPWKEFLDIVKRLRITRKDEAIFPISSSLF